jgi:hypothetical protein
VPRSDLTLPSASALLLADADGGSSALLDG